MKHDPDLAVDVRALRCDVAGRSVLQLAHLQVRAGERVALIGPNGAGKSTLLRCLGALATPASGQVRVLGAEVAALRGAALRAWRCDVAQVMQSLHLVLADEPTAALDPSAAEAVCRLLGGPALQAAAGDASPATLITVVHNPGLLPLLADRVLALRQGALAFDLPLGQVTPALLAQLYGADAPPGTDAGPGTQTPGMAAAAPWQPVPPGVAWRGCPS